MRPPEEATRQEKKTKAVMWPGYTLPPEELITTPPAISANRLDNGDGWKRPDEEEEEETRCVARS